MTMSDAVLIAVLATIPPTVTALLAFIKVMSVEKSVRETHLAVNSRMDELLRITRESSRAEGIQEQKDKSGI